MSFSSNEAITTTALNKIIQLFYSDAKVPTRLQDFILRNGEGEWVIDFPSIVVDEHYYFEDPGKIPVESASNWTKIHLRMLKVQFQEPAINDFINNHPISPEAENLIVKLSTLSLSTFRGYPKDGYAETAGPMDDVNGLLDHPLTKALYLINKYPTREGIVDAFVGDLLTAVGFKSGMLYPFPQFEFNLQFGALKKTAQPDFSIMDIISFYRMAVVEDKSRNKAKPNSEPQLIAEAIALHQANLNIERGRADKRQKKNHSVAAGEELSNEVFGLRVNGSLFSFYKIPITKAILDVMETMQEAHQVTNVLRFGGNDGLDFLEEHSRREIIHILDYFCCTMRDRQSCTEINGNYNC